MNTRSMSELELEMARAVKELLGSGYILDYYTSAASDFVDIATAHGADSGKQVVVRYEE